VNQIDFKPLDDETLYGENPGWQPAFYWPFGELLANFWKLAKRNLIGWPLNADWQWKNIEQVKDAMQLVYSKLPQNERQFIAEDYLWFVNHTEFDWKQAAEEMRKNINT